MTLTDTLPFPASSLVSASGGYSLQGNNIVWNVGVLPVGLHTETFNVVVRIPSDTPFGNVFTNTAMAMPSAAEHDVDLGNNTRVFTDTVISSTIGLFINNALPITTAKRGDLVTYTVQYGISGIGPHNEGNSDATDTRITDTIPTGMSFVSSTALFTSRASGNMVTWFVGSMYRYQSGASNVFTVTLRVNNDTFGGQVLNIVTIGSNEFELSPANNTSAAPLTINAPVATHGVAVSPPPTQTASAGTTVTTTFIVSNTGTAPDIFTLTYSQTLGWANFVGLPSFVALAASASTTVQIPVTVPPGATAGQVNEIRFTARSQADAAKTATQATTISAGQRKVSLPIVIRDSTTR